MSRVLAFLLLLPAFARPQDIVVTHVRLFDGDRVHEDATVVVRGERVEAVRTTDAAVAARPGARVIDGNGQTLLPGLIDSHTHIQSRDDLVASLALGVTTDLSLHGQPSSDRAIRGGLSEAGARDRADLYSAGFAATVPGGHGTEYGFKVPTITEPSEAVGWVDARIAEGSDVIKIMYEEGGENGRITRPSIEAPTLAALINSAHAHSKLAIVHIHTDSQAMQAIRAGADGLAHLYLFGKDEVDPQFAPMLAKRNMFVISTLTVLRSVCGLMPGREVLEDSRLTPYLRAEDTARLEKQIAIAKPTDYERPRKELIQLLANGVTILAGTDAHNLGTAPGASLHAELAFLVEAGMTPLQALRAATSAPARVFHWADRGRIAPGTRADLLLVDGDPTADITTTRNIRAVWKSGIEFDREAWRQRLHAPLGESPSAAGPGSQ
jgi:imidazolonepropionase-like amidohydrolase